MTTKKDLEKLNHDIADGSPRTRIGVSKLRRRMGSFKDDFLDKMMSIRSPSGISNGSRSNSPKLKNRNRSGSPKRPCSPADSYDSGPENPLKDLENQVKQVQVALRYFQDVISKNKLEMLPGNGTIVLETVANIHGVLKKSYALDEQSSLIVSGLNQVYQSVAKLIKLCDDLLISGEKAANQEYVTETIHSVEEAVQNLVSIANDKIAERENRNVQSESSASSRCSTVSSDPSHYRVSLPEIIMSPNELQLLEQTTQSVIERHLSRSNYHDNVDNPPPKPPHPSGDSIEESPPPLPPKKRPPNANVTSNTTAVVPNTSLSLERLSLKSDNSSVASFDSATGTFRSVDTSSIDGSTPKRSSRTRASSSSCSGFVSLYNSSQSFVEQQKQQQRNVFASTTTANSSAVDEMVMTTTHSETTYSVVTKIIPSSVRTSIDDEIPPALPVKTRKTNHNMLILNREGCIGAGGSVKERCPSTDDMLSNGHGSENGSPPPLPLKKRHIR